MKRYVNLALAAAILMIAVDLFVLFGLPKLQGQDDVHTLPVVESSIYVHSEIADFESSKVASGWKDLNVPEPSPEKYTVNRLPIVPDLPKAGPVPQPTEIVKVPEPEPEPIRHEGEPAKIVIIIDDMGMDRKRSKRTVDLPAPVTLAFLPYAKKLEEFTAPAAAKGHELIIHMPMQPQDMKLNTGPIALKSGMSAEEIDTMLEKAFASFKGYVGMNNHMGSKVTKDEAIMRRVMAALKARGLFFVDSKTVESSVGSKMAKEAGIPYGDRDVFLDHQDTSEFVWKALRQTERVASKKGYAIAIGHPKDSTINALKEWLPTLESRGFVLVPVSDVLRGKNAEQVEPKKFAPGVLFEPAAGSETIPVTELPFSAPAAPAQPQAPQP